MGTLFSQSPRNYRVIARDDIRRTAEMVKALAADTGLTPTNIIALMHVLELERASDIHVNDCDIKDEQLAGFGEIMNRLCDALEGLPDHINRKERNT